MKYKIINLVREDFNKSIVFYNASSEKVKEYYKKLYDWLSKNTESDLYANFKKNDGYKRSVELSKSFDLYRQNYCGCKYSIWFSMSISSLLLLNFLLVIFMQI